MDEYLTIGQAATLLHVSPTTVRRWVHQGTLQAHKIQTGKNAHVLIKKGNVEGLLVPVQPSAALPSAKNRQTAVDDILAFQHKLAGRKIDVDRLIARKQKIVKSERGKTEGSIGRLKRTKYGFSHRQERSLATQDAAGQRAMVSANLNTLLRDLLA